MNQISPIDFACELANASEILRHRAEQIQVHGHDDHWDEDKSPADLIAIGHRFALDARDLTFPGERQDLAIAKRRCAKAAAMMLAAMRRIDRLQQRDGELQL